MNRIFYAMALGFALASQTATIAQDSPSQKPVVTDGPAVVVKEGRVAFTEGPAWRPDGNVLFSDIPNDRIMRRDPDGVMHIFRTPSGWTNGMIFDLQGRLLCCENKNRRITRTEKNGTITVLTGTYEGNEYNSPNDIAIDTKGRIYFSDPRYGDKSNVRLKDKNGKIIEGVYRIDPDGSVTRVITHEVDRPNGIIISPDGKTIYIADNVNDGPDALGGNRKVWKFKLLEDGSIDLKSQECIFDFGSDRGPDGMAIDTKGRIYVTAGFNFPSPPVETAKKYKAGVYVIDSSGKLLQFIPIPEDMCTNCTFGGEDMKTLFVTAGHKLWSVRVNTPGYQTWLSK